MVSKAVVAARQAAMTRGELCPHCESLREKEFDQFKCGSRYVSLSGKPKLVATLLCLERVKSLR